MARSAPVDSKGATAGAVGGGVGEGGTALLAVVGYFVWRLLRCQGAVITIAVPPADSGDVPVLLLPL